MYYRVLAVIAFFGFTGLLFARPGLATRRSGIATGQTPKQVKRRASGISALESKNIEKRHERYGDKEPEDDNLQKSGMRQQMRVGTNNPRPGQVYTVIENGVTVRKTYPMNSAVEETPDVSQKNKASSMTQTEAQKYANLTPWFRAKLLGKKVPEDPKDTSSGLKGAEPASKKIDADKKETKLKKPASQKVETVKK